jgi:hypothetical protein
MTISDYSSRVEENSILRQLQADKRKLFPSRRVLIKTLQRRGHKCVLLKQQNQQLQEENTFLKQRLQDNRYAHQRHIKETRNNLWNESLRYVNLLEDELDQCRKKIGDPQATIQGLRSELFTTASSLDRRMARSIFECLCVDSDGDYSDSSDLDQFIPERQLLDDSAGRRKESESL